jgi:hypothetical protein
MFDLFQSLGRRGSIASLFGVAALLAGWVALHAFGPGRGFAQSGMVFLAADIVFGTFAIAALLAVVHILVKAAAREIAKKASASQMVACAADAPYRRED